MCRMLMNYYYAFISDGPSGNLTSTQIHDKWEKFFFSKLFLLFPGRTSYIHVHMNVMSEFHVTNHNLCHLSVRKILSETHCSLFNHSQPFKYEGITNKQKDSFFIVINHNISAFNGFILGLTLNRKDWLSWAELVKWKNWNRRDEANKNNNFASRLQICHL